MMELQLDDDKIVGMGNHAAGHLYLFHDECWFFINAIQHFPHMDKGFSIAHNQISDITCVSSHSIVISCFKHLLVSNC